MRRSRAMAAVLAIVAATAFVACSSGGDESGGGGNTITIDGKDANDHGTERVDSDSIEVEADNEEGTSTSAPR